MPAGENPALRLNILFSEAASFWIDKTSEIME